jgi:hypothetical protein
MPIVRLTKNSQFNPEEIRLLVGAFEAACSAARLVGPADPRRDIVARKIIEAAQAGERDPFRLQECGLLAAKQDDASA